MLSCKEASALASSELDRKLPLLQRLGLRTHLMMCKYCRRYKKQLQMLRDMARQYEAMELSASPSERLSPEAVDRIANKLKAHSR